LIEPIFKLFWLFPLRVAHAISTPEVLAEICFYIVELMMYVERPCFDSRRLSICVIIKLLVDVFQNVAILKVYTSRVNCVLC
jgi:hypothetical protein